MTKCNNCDDGIEFISCCSGSDCGCGGFPVAAKNCPSCNKDNKEPTDKKVKQILEYVEWVGD